VRVISLAVASRGRAASRAPSSRSSTGAGLARRARGFSSQAANSSNCGADGFSIAFSIPAIPLMDETYHAQTVNDDSRAAARTAVDLVDLRAISPRLPTTALPPPSVSVRALSRR